MDLKKEQPITLNEVPNHVPKRGGRTVHYSTVYRWTTKGSRGRVLESTLVGGIRYTTVEAVQRFLAIAPAAKRSSVEEVAIDEALKRAGV